MFYIQAKFYNPMKAEHTNVIDVLFGYIQLHTIKKLTNLSSNECKISSNHKVKKLHYLPCSKNTYEEVSSKLCREHLRDDINVGHQSTL